MNGPHSSEDTASFKDGHDPSASLLLYSNQDSSASREAQLSNRIIELAERVKHAEMINLERKKELIVLRKRLQELSWISNSNNSNKTMMNKSMTHPIASNTLISNPLLTDSSSSIQVPSLYSLLPHLLKASSSPNNDELPSSQSSSSRLPFTSLNNFDPLKPAFVKKATSSPSASKSIVFGVPTVRRPVESYLFSTLMNLIENLTPEEAQISLIVVFIAETDLEYVESQAALISDQFSKEIEMGLLEIVSPPASYYPDLDSVTATLGDTVERTKWRTKQNLDFAYLMMYCQPKATYYVQLEDDVLTKKGYPSKMLTYALKQTATKPDWLLLDFCQLGFIGKMFKSRDLSSLTLMFLIFQHDKPVDWILTEYARVKYCRMDKDTKDCRKQLATKWLFYRPSLFQHIGTHSSLKGKVQKLKDKNFGRVSLFKSHSGENPPAKASSSLHHYKDFSIERAYVGRTYFWGYSPSRGDFILFNFTAGGDKPLLQSFYFKSGNSEHPEDKLPVNSTIDILPETDPFALRLKLSSSAITSDINEPNDEIALLDGTPSHQIDTKSRLPKGVVRSDGGYFTVGYFKATGVAEGVIPPEFGPIQSLRIKVAADSERWVILSEVSLVCRDCLSICILVFHDFPDI